MEVKFLNDRKMKYQVIMITDLSCKLLRFLLNMVIKEKLNNEKYSQKVIRHHSILRHIPKEKQKEPVRLKQKYI